MLGMNRSGMLFSRTTSLKFREMEPWLFRINMDGKLMPPVDTGPYRIERDFTDDAIKIINSFGCVVGSVLNGA
jgi:hypothetical protein